MLLMEIHRTETFQESVSEKDDRETLINQQYTNENKSGAIA